MAPSSLFTVLERLLRLRVDGFENEEASTQLSAADAEFSLKLKTSSGKETSLGLVAKSKEKPLVTLLSRPFLPLAAQVDSGKWNQLESDLKSFMSTGFLTDFAIIC